MGMRKVELVAILPHLGIHHTHNVLVVIFFPEPFRNCQAYKLTHIKPLDIGFCVVIDSIRAVQPTRLFCVAARLLAWLVLTTVP